MLSWLKENGVADVVLTGALQRPDWKKKVDARGMKIIAKVALRRLGDDGLLRAIRSEKFEADGIRLRGIHEFMPELLAPKGAISKALPQPGRLGRNSPCFNAS